MKLGVITDLHYTGDARPGRWIGAYDRVRLGERLELALAFAAEATDTVVLLGDLTEYADARLTEQLVRTTSASASRVIATAGNHELQSSACVDLATVHPVQAAGDPLGIGIVELAGTDARPLGTVRFNDAARRGALVVSHYPILSRRATLEAAGHPYSGDLENRIEVERAVRELGLPTVVVCGHLHVRDAAVSGQLIQIACAALVESPHDLTLLTLEPGRLVVERIPIGFDYAVTRDQWQLTRGDWRRV